jgi:hypothetical protein
MNAHTNITRAADARFLPDLRRLDRLIAAAMQARKAAMCGTLFADTDGLVLIQAARSLFQSDDLDTLYGEVWAAAGATTVEDEIDALVRGLDAVRGQERVS